MTNVLWKSCASIARTILPHSAIKWLRGDFKSVIGRLNAAREQIKLKKFQKEGGAYLDWYAQRMDAFAANPVIDPKTKRYYHDTGSDDLETLQTLGLKPDDFLHEFGCGFLRSAYYFIEFLEPGRFSGNDTSGERLRTGVEYIKNTYNFDINAKEPILVTNRDNSFDWIDRKVDVIWCHAVFTHMPEDDIDETIRNARKIMKSDSKFYFTYSQKPNQSGDVERMAAQDWWHKHEFFVDLASRYGLNIEDMTKFIQDRGCYRPEHRLAKMSLA